MKNQKRGFKLHYLYVIADLIVGFIISFLPFMGIYGVLEIDEHISAALIFAGATSLVTALVFLVFRIYRILTKDIGMFESLKIVLITFVVQVVGLIVIAIVPQLPSIVDYLWVWFLQAATACFIYPSIRVLARLLNVFINMSKKKEKIRTLIIGAGASGKVVVDESRRNDANKNQVIVFVDDDVNKIGGTFCNLPVKGPISDIGTIISYYNIEEVIIAISEITQERLHEILGILETCPVRVRRLPMISEMQGPNDTRIIDVDLNDLLCRDPISLDNHEVNNMLRGKTVLVTGAGGSIGSELVRQIFNTHPKRLLLFDIYENSTYDIQMELNKRLRDEEINDIEVIALIGSTYNDFRVEQIIKTFRPDYIYHAAAYKHVPLMEDSPAEAIRTNVIGTYNVARFADKYKVKKMVLVSTDKAVRPTNVMGATKRFAEMIIQHFASESKNTAYAAVRFGNVLGSNGSVVPLFKKQIEAGGPVTLTHKDIIRYFMTIPEAVSLILQCGLFASGGEIFILDMGKPVKIYNLAEKLIRQAGLVPGRDIKIVETGLRPGEKLYEELLLDTKKQKKTKNSKIYIESNDKPNDDIEKDIGIVSSAFGMEHRGDVKRLLASVIKTYKITNNDK